MGDAGFQISAVRDFNKVGVLAWLMNGKLLHLNHISPIQLKIFDMLTPLIRKMDGYLPWNGLNVVVVGSKEI